MEDCESLENNPVLLYKPQGGPLEHFENSDFCLIIMNDLQESLLKQFGKNIFAIGSTHDEYNEDVVINNKVLNFVEITGETADMISTEIMKTILEVY